LLYIGPFSTFFQPQKRPGWGGIQKRLLPVIGARGCIRETKMKTIAFAAIGITAVALSACAGRYYDERGYYGSRGHVEYSDRGSYDRDRDGIPNRYDRDRDNDGVPNYADRSPSNPYRN